MSADRDDWLDLRDTIMRLRRVGTLTKRHLLVMRLRTEGWTLREIGTRLGRSAERARIIEAEAHRAVWQAYGYEARRLEWLCPPR